MPAPEPDEPAPARSQEEPEETWEEKEDKLDPEKVKQADQKYRYKEGESSGRVGIPVLFFMAPLGEQVSDCCHLFWQELCCG